MSIFPRVARVVDIDRIDQVTINRDMKVHPKIILSYHPYIKYPNLFCIVSGVYCIQS